MKARIASLEDCAFLAAKNHEFIRDEGHRNTMTIPELEQRMREWLAGGKYRAVIFEDDSMPVAYALYCAEEDSGIYLRHFFVFREHRREGVGRAAIELLFSEVFPRGSRVTVGVLSGNESGRRFWEAVGFRDYSLTLERFSKA
jgi:GNAT superfamily N-acetyltransferase